MGFIDENDQVPTPPASVDEHEAIQIPIEYMSSLARGLGNLENHLEKIEDG